MAMAGRSLRFGILMVYNFCRVYFLRSISGKAKKVLRCIRAFEYKS